MSKAIRLADEMRAIWSDMDSIGEKRLCESVEYTLRSQDALIKELAGALRECSDRMEIHMKHSEDLVAHMAAIAALAKVEP